MVLCCKRDEETTEEVQARKLTKAFEETKKILLLGTGESGKTTIIKQMRILHINGFSDDERKEKISNIKQNIHESIYVILFYMDKILPPVYARKEESKLSIEFILNMGPKEPESYTEEYFDHVKIAWTDEGVKEAFSRSNEYQLIDSAEHFAMVLYRSDINFFLKTETTPNEAEPFQVPSFLNRIDEIRKHDYMPTTQDILFCRVTTVTISKIEFEVPISKFHGGKARFWMYDVGGQRGHRKRWIQCFDGIQAILFLMAASDFDQTLREDSSKNRLQEAFDLFKDIYINKYVRDAGLIVFLNKQDNLKKKILEQKRELDKYFPEFTNYVPDKKEGWDGENEYDRARFFMKDQILKIASTPIKIENVGFVPGYNINEELPPREVYIHYTIATDTNNIKKVFESVQEIILKSVLEVTLY